MTKKKITNVIAVVPYFVMAPLPIFKLITSPHFVQAIPFKVKIDLRILPHPLALTIKNTVGIIIFLIPMNILLIVVTFNRK